VKTPSGRWYVRGAEVGRVTAQARLDDGITRNFRVPHPVHVESTLWMLLGAPAENADHFLAPVVFENRGQSSERPK